MLENKKVNGVHASRYIASWGRVGGSLRYGTGLEDFSDWLRSLGISDDDVADIREMASMGRLELEQSARYFIHMQNNK